MKKILLALVCLITASQVVCAQKLAPALQQVNTDADAAMVSPVGRVHPLIGITASTGKTTSVVGQNYYNAVLRAGGIPVIIPVDTTTAYLAEVVKELDGLLLVGGVDVDPSFFGEAAHEKLGEVDTLRDVNELKLIRLASNRNIPILGVNMGRLGFLADFTPDDLESAIDMCYSGKLRTEQHTVLEVLYSMGKTADYPFALNEVAVLKRDNSSMISIRVDVGGQYLTTYQADGIIINTPTGSTGYALSVGGPVMAPGCGTIGIVPVAPHSLSVRPITISDDMEVTLTVESRSHNFLVAIDGRSEKCQEGTKLHIRKAPYKVSVIRRPEGTFFHTLRTKLMWGSDVRTGEEDNKK